MSRQLDHDVAVYLAGIIEGVAANILEFCEQRKAYEKAGEGEKEMYFKNKQINRVGTV